VPRSVDDPYSTNRANVEGTLNILLAARDAGVHVVVYASSSSVYGNDLPLPLREDQAVTPVSPYAISKLANEHYARVFTRLYGLRTVGLRYFNVFGPRQDPESHYATVVPRFLLAGLRGDSLEIHGDGLQSRDFTYVKNVVLANVLAAESEAAAGEVVNVACGAKYSLMDIVQWLSRTVGREERTIRWHHTPGRAGDVRHTLADVSKAERLLGYRPVVGFEEGLALTLDALVAEHPSLSVVA
jgi:UDP-glucose 4-epimerase